MTDHDLDILARTIYGEARGEFAKYGPSALIAVANVIINRWKRGGKYGKTITEVCFKPKQFSCWDVNDPNRTLIQQEDLIKDPLFKISQTIAKKTVSGVWPDLTRESDHYHATYCKPYWAKINKLRIRLGRHIFYKLDEGELR
jgi:N-acetylmuramoyl-L-alanine amidase